MKLRAALLILSIILLGAMSCTSKHDHVNKTVQQYHCPMHPNIIQDKKGSCPICGMDLVPIEKETHEATAPAKKTMYRSTMNPKEISDKPGKDSMGMQMEAYEVESSASSNASDVRGYSGVKIDPDRQQLIGVKKDTVKKRNLVKRIRAVGKVSYDPELYNAQQEYITVLRHYNEMKTGSSPEVAEHAKSMLTSARFKLKLLGLSEGVIDDIGRRSEPDASLLIAAGSRSAWVYAQIYEYDLAYVKLGQTALVRLPSGSGRELVGRVSSIDPVLNPETRSVRVRILVDNTMGMLKSEIYVNVNFVIPVGTILAIPEDAVLDTGTRNIIFVVMSNGSFEPREAVLGEKVDEYYPVISGVKEGETVVTSANFLIDSESQLKAALKQMSGGN